MVQRPTFVLSGLREKRARLAGEIQAAQRALNAQRDTLATLDAVIRLFEPDSNPELIPAIRPVGRTLYFRRGERTRMILSALREAGKPATCRFVTEYLIRAKGLEAMAPKARVAFTEQVRTALARLESRGFLRRIVVWPDTWWELAP